MSAPRSRPSRFPLSLPVLLAAGAAGLAISAGPGAKPAAYERLQLDGAYLSEGASLGDLNRDGHADAVSGPHWWEGPAFEKKHTFYPPAPVDGDKPGYVQDNFFSFVHDCNGDGWNDVLTIGLPGTPSFWYENPGQAERPNPGHWERHHVLDGVGNESPTLADGIGGDGKPELWCIVDGKYGFATPDPAAPAKSWTFHPVIEAGDFHRFTHGMGLGDLNGDGRQDLLTKDGWYEQPAADPAAASWTWRAFSFRPKRLEPMFGGAQIYASDVDGDGDADLVTSIHAHGYGLAWFEQARTEDGLTVFLEHTILKETPEPGPDGVQFSQLHAMAMADVNGDGLEDIVTGKCRYAHGPDGDPDPKGTPVLYAFLLQRGEGGVRYQAQRLDEASGVGRQVSVAEVNGDGRPDLIVGNKLGTFVFRSQ